MFAQSIMISNGRAVTLLLCVWHWAFLTKSSLFFQVQPQKTIHVTYSTVGGFPCIIALINLTVTHCIDGRLLSGYAPVYVNPQGGRWGLGGEFDILIFRDVQFPTLGKIFALKLNPKNLQHPQKWQNPKNWCGRVFEKQILYRIYSRAMVEVFSFWENLRVFFFWSSVVGFFLIIFGKDVYFKNLSPPTYLMGDP